LPPGWPLVEEAVDAKIEDQREVVRWWDTDGPGANYGGAGELTADGQKFGLETKDPGHASASTAMTFRISPATVRVGRVRAGR
jgi:hypothetical protein